MCIRLQHPLGLFYSTHSLRICCFHALLYPIHRILSVIYIRVYDSKHDISTFVEVWILFLIILAMFSKVDAQRRKCSSPNVRQNCPLHLHCHYLIIYRVNTGLFVAVAVLNKPVRMVSGLSAWTWLFAATSTRPTSRGPWSCPPGPRTGARSCRWCAPSQAPGHQSCSHSRGYAQNQHLKHR